MTPCELGWLRMPPCAGDADAKGGKSDGASRRISREAHRTRINQHRTRRLSHNVTDRGSARMATQLASRILRKSRSLAVQLVCTLQADRKSVV